MRDGQRLTVIGGVFVAVAAVIGIGAYSVLADDGGEDNDTGTTVAATLDGRPGGQSPEIEPLSAEEVRQVAADFLAAWETGDTRAAADLTDDPDAARDSLDALAEAGAFSELDLSTRGVPSGDSVPFLVDGQVAFEGSGGQQETDFGYESELAVVREAAGGRPVVRWEPGVVHPDLAEGETLATTPLVDQAPVDVLDVNGDVLTAQDYPSLAPVLADVKERYAEEAGASAGSALSIVDAEGATVEQLTELAQPASGEVPTTIDPAMQAAAEQAVAQQERDASLVAVKPSTGEIQAIVNQPADGFNTALQGSYAPGSTFKVVTASLLMHEGLASPDEPHPCPKFFEYGGWRFQNDDKFEIEDGTFRDSFSASCNTAFISQAPKLDDDSLGNHARDVFGLGQTWAVGARTMDGSVPTMSDAQMAASLIGQGGVRMNPLTMASVSATVKNGGFLQPYLVPASFDGRQLAQARQAMSGEVAANLQSLMNTTALYGTAAEAMAGMDGDFGAKTGSAEVDGQENPNAWFTAYRNDLAVAAVVPDSGHGGEFAGPIVADVLQAGP